MCLGCQSSPDGQSVGVVEACGVWKREEIMLLLLALILALAWVAGFGVFHVASAAIHVLIVLAVVSVAAHLIRGRSTV